MAATVIAAVNGFAVLVMLTLLASVLWQKDTSRERSIYILVTVSLCLFLAAASAQEIAEENMWPRVIWTALECMTLGFYALFPYLWGQLVDVVCTEGEQGTNWNRSVYLFLFAVNLALIVLSAFVPVLFFYDENGALAEEPAAMTVFILFNYASFVCSMIQILRCRNRLSGEIFVTMMLVPLAPLVAMILDMLYPEACHVYLFAIEDVMQYSLFQYTRYYRDSLTGLGNRTLMLAKLEAWFSSRHRQTICGIVLDVDGLREINRVEGHKAGDAALIQVAGILKDLSGRKFSAIRYGGDEFLVLWTTSGAADPDPVLGEIRRGRKAIGEGREHPVRFSIGEYHCTNQDGVTVEGFLASVDSSLYQKQREIDRILSQAVEEKAFRVVYQPIFSLHTDSFRSAEALTRLTFQGKAIPPDEFIPAAERSGTIHYIGEFVLSEVCAFVSGADFQNSGLEMVELNLSVAQCMDPRLAQKLISIVDSYGVPHKRICFEITETAIISDEEHFWQNIHALAESGFGLALDDFGSGYSNLNRLTTLPLNLIKLDRTLAPQGAKEDCGMLEDFIRYLRHISAQIIMEGVETFQQSETTRQLGCDAIQGFYYARPMSRQVLTEFLRERQN